MTKQTAKKMFEKILFDYTCDMVTDDTVKMARKYNKVKTEYRKTPLINISRL